MKRMRPFFFLFLILAAAAPAHGGEAEETIVQDEPLSKKYDYWENGNVRECRIYDERGDLIVKSDYREGGTLERRELHNKRGDVIQQCHYAMNGKLEDGIDGWAAMQRRYYGDGTLAEESWYDDEGYVKERKRYSMSGNLVDTQYMGDNDIDPNEEFNPYLLGGTTQEFFDSYGHLEATASAYRE